MYLDWPFSSWTRLYIHKAALGARLCVRVPIMWSDRRLSSCWLHISRHPLEARSSAHPVKHKPYFTISIQHTKCTRVRFGCRHLDGLLSIWLSGYISPNNYILWTCKLFGKKAIMAVPLHEQHGISNHRQIDCLVNSIFRLTEIDTSKLHSISSLCGGIQR